MTFRARNLFTLAVLAMFGMVRPASAALVVYEPFADPQLTLAGNTPGTGLSGTWSSASVFNIAPGSLAYGSLPTSGNQVVYVSPFGNAAASATLSSALGSAGLLNDGATLWFSMVTTTPLTGGANPDTGFALGTDQLGSDNNFQMPAGGQGIGWEIKNGVLRATTWNNTPDRTATGPSAGLGVTRLIVGEIAWGATAGDLDTLKLYLPDTSLNLGAAVSTKTAILNQSLFDTITFSLKTNTSFGIDEIRFGSSFDDVIGATGIPEPASVALLSLGGLAMMRRRRTA